MIKKTIKFTNFLDQEEQDDFYFNFSKGELVKMQMAAIDQHTESFTDKLEKIGKNLQGAELVAVLDDIILNGYGEKTTDGKGFVKVRNGVRLSESFQSSGAYSELVTELCTNATAMAEFVNGLMPANLREQVRQEAATSQSARERSQATLQGHMPKQEAPKSTVEVVPELPAAEPVLEAPVAQEHSISDLEAMLAARKAAAEAN